MSSRAIALIREETWRSWLILATVLLVPLVINEIGFRVAAKSQAQVADLALEGLLQREALLINPHLLGQAISDLEHLGLIRCTSIISETRPEVRDFINGRTGSICSRGATSWIEPTLGVQRALKGGNGETWQARYQVVLGPGFALGLWGSRIFLSTLILVLWFALRARLRHQRAVFALKSAHAEELYKVATQVSHDINSPVAALEGLLQDTAEDEIPSTFRTELKKELRRICDTAHDLKSRFRRGSARRDTAASDRKHTEPELLAPLIEGVVSEKRLAFRSQQGLSVEFLCTPENYGLFAAIDGAKFQRIISNLLNNAIEALPDCTGRVKVSLTQRNDKIALSIADTGKGIPPEVLKQLGARGATFGKASGSGYGFHDAKTTIDSWNGELQIQSELSRGTCIQVLLPKAFAPRWFLESLYLRPGQTVLVLDDEERVHDAWSRRLKAIYATKPPIQFHQFLMGSTFRDWVQDHADSAPSTCYLLDQELPGESDTGLDIAEALGIGSRVVLVTNKYDDSKVQARCTRLGCRLLPKPMIEAIPIEVIAPHSVHLDAAFIDDDPAFHANWKRSARKHGKEIRCFVDPEQFIALEWMFMRSVPIYVDVDLGGGVSGIEVSRRISHLGFMEIHLATAYSRDVLDMRAMPWIQSTTNKLPPWDAPEI